MTDLQKANVGKRIMAALFDGILLATLAVGIAVVLSFCLGYDAKVERYDAIMNGYEQQYDLDLQEYSLMGEEDKSANREKAEAIYTALSNDEEFLRLDTVIANLKMILLSFSLLGAVLLMELFIPLWLGNGQTLGKKIFGIGVMHIEGIRITGKEVFIRAVLGKYTLETMLPIYILLMTFTGGLGFVGLLLLAALLIAQIVCIVITRTNAPIHDVFAATVAVDLASQRIFEDREDRDNYIKAIHAERAARADY